MSFAALIDLRDSVDTMLQHREYRRPDRNSLQQHGNKEIALTLIENSPKRSGPAHIKRDSYHLGAVDVFGSLSTDRWDIGIVVEYICRIILRLQFAQAKVVFRAVCRTHAVSLVSRNEIGVGPAGSIGRERITQPLRPGDLSSRAVNHQVTMSVVD